MISYINNIVMTRKHKLLSLSWIYQSCSVDETTSLTLVYKKVKLQTEINQAFNASNVITPEINMTSFSLL